jgi:hypothetical protein
MNHSLNPAFITKSSFLILKLLLRLRFSMHLRFSLNLIVFALLLISANLASAQHGYWQQEVVYDMDIKMNPEKHQYQGEQSIEYTNNSPDTLTQVFYHLYFNAFQPGSMMDVRSRNLPDPDRRVGSRISKLEEGEIGFQKINWLKQEGKKLDFEVAGTVAEVKLDQPLLPGQTTTLSMKFDAQVPVQIRRSGRNNKEGVEFTMTQWYPKLAEYDKDGWATSPYVGREFHGVFGTYNVNITIDSSYTVAGSGVLQNPDEIGHGYSKTKATEKELTWKFKAEKVHDFAWAADTNYVHKQTALENGTELHFFHLQDSILDSMWIELMPKTVELFNIMNNRFGEYPYPQFSVIQGGDGGMEYPMCTMITAKGSFGGLVSVTVHEAIHNWYYGVLASNESKYPWMDEGFTTYAQNIVLDSIRKSDKPNPHDRSYRGYIASANSGEEEPLTTHADHYSTNRHFGINSYSKGCVFLHQLSSVMGQEAFDKGMLAYWNMWQFKHPTADDFKRVMEKTSGLELEWYFEHWVGTTKSVDYTIKNVIADGGKTKVVLQRIGEMPMPIEVSVVTDKDSAIHYIPLEVMRGAKPAEAGSGKWKQHTDWPWTYEFYELIINAPFGEIKSIEVDASGKLADVERKNNAFPSEQMIIFQPKK